MPRRMFGSLAAFSLLIFKTSPADFIKFAGFLHEVLVESKAVQEARGKLLKDFNV